MYCDTAFYPVITMITVRCSSHEPGEQLPAGDK